MHSLSTMVKQHEDISMAAEMGFLFSFLLWLHNPMTTPD